jgi:hypothetical protein
MSQSHRVQDETVRDRWADKEMCFAAVLVARGVAVQIRPPSPSRIYTCLLRRTAHPSHNVLFGIAAGDYLMASFESMFSVAGSSRKGSLNLWEISGQNSRSTS